MKLKFMFPFFITLIATGCGNHTPADATANCPVPFYSPLPDPALHFDFRFHVASDRLYQTAKGQDRRRLVIEYLDGDAATVWNHVEHAMVAAGYSLRKEREEPVVGKGTFSKAGVPSLFVDASGGRPTAPAHPDARGTIWISWAVTDVTMPASTATAASPSKS